MPESVLQPNPLDGSRSTRANDTFHPVLVNFPQPRPLHLSHPVTFVLVGGFLGSGKTTALAALGRSLTKAGHRVGFITNDQAPNLVDTASLQILDAPVAEVAGGCFCCRFEDLLDAAQSVLNQDVDVLLCEPVGSCTDMVATVIAPLQQFYGESLRLAPFTVLVDAHRLRQSALDELPQLFPDEVSYIFRKQLEEADLVCLNKIDMLPEGEAERLQQALVEWLGRPALGISALHGDGMAEWQRLLFAGSAPGSHALREIDYDTYALGEAELGWLNGTVRLSGPTAIDGAHFVEILILAIRDACRAAGAEIAHVKLSLTAGGETIRANVTRSSEDPRLEGSLSNPVSAADLVINARVRMDPEFLREMVTDAVACASTEQGADAEITSIQSFRPGYPHPPYRIPSLGG